MHRISWALAALALSASSALAGQEGGAACEGPSAFSFRDGQNVYITAFHKAEHVSKGRTREVQPSAVIDGHLPAELRVRKDFERRNIYRLVDKADRSDFVMLVLIDDSAAEALALPPSVFAQYRNNPDMEALRAASYARWTAGPLLLHSLARLSDRLVTSIHSVGRAVSATP